MSERETAEQRQRDPPERDRDRDRDRDGERDEPGGWQHRHAVALLLGLTAYCATYLGLQLSGSPLLYYVPELRTFTFAPPPGAHVMGYYGLLLASLFGFAVGFALGWLPLVRRIFSRRFYGGALVLMATVAVFGSMGAVLLVELLS